MPSNLENSEKLFEKMRDFFVPRYSENCFIRISPELPMEEWEVYRGLTPEETNQKRLELKSEGYWFSGISIEGTSLEFHFVDKYMIKAQMIPSMEIELFVDKSFQEHDMAQIAAELKGLQKFLEKKAG